MTTLYPMFYGTRLVPLETLKATFEPRMHPEFARRLFNFIESQHGFFGIGGGFRGDGQQPDKPGFAPPGKTFHMKQVFPSGIFYAAVDLVVIEPGKVHRAPRWDEVPAQGRKSSFDYGVHCNVGTPGQAGSESWHMQPVEIDGWDTWFNRGRRDLVYGYVIKNLASEQPAAPFPPAQPPVPATQPDTKKVTVEFTSRVLVEGSVGPDVKFFQRQLNDIAGQGLVLDGYFGPSTTEAVKNWQRFFGPAIGLIVDGQLGPKTQQSIIEVALQAA